MASEPAVTRASLVALVVLSSAPALADKPDAEQLARAKAHYEAGLGLYHLGKYRQAIEDFAAGYQLSHRAKFLINIAQSYRGLREYRQAREMFERYMAEAPASDPERAIVKKELEQLPTQNEPPSKTPAPPTILPPTPTGSGTSTPTETAATAQTAGTTTAALTTSPAPKHRDKRLWLLLPASILVAAGAGVGIYFAVRPHASTCASDPSCFDFRH
jgi:tetratricopeptide (TPR) repeat protein